MARRRVEFNAKQTVKSPHIGGGRRYGNTNPAIGAQVGAAVAMAAGKLPPGPFGASSKYLSRLTDTDLEAHCRELTVRERTLNIEVTAALEECQRRHAARVALVAYRAEARVA